MKEATDGMNVAIKNSQRLLEDSELLLNSKRFASALSLSILAIEEAGKVSIIRRILIIEDSEISAAWRDYRNHRSKNVAWILPELIENGARTLIELKEAANQHGEHTKILNGLKQIGIYSDFVGNRNWCSPEDAVDENLASSIFDVAKILCSKDLVREEEIEAWVRHLGHGNVSLEALHAYFSEMIEKGFLSDNVESMENFIFSHRSE